MRTRDRIDELTASLRGDPEILWANLRALLRERALDPEKCLLIEFFPDDTDLYFGILITQNKRAVQFDLDLGQRGIQPAFSHWEDITDSPASPYAGLVEAGLFRLNDEGGAIL